MFFPLFVLTKTLLNVEKHYQDIKTIFKQYLTSCTSSICIYLKRVGNKYFFCEGIYMLLGMFVNYRYCSYILKDYHW